MTTTNHDHLPTANADHRPAGRRRARRVLAVLGAAVAALTIWAVAVPLAGTT